MLDSLEGYLYNIAAAATQTAENGGPLAELAASLAVSIDTVARQQIEIKRLVEQINALKKKEGAVTAGVPVTRGTNQTLLIASIVQRWADRLHIATISVTLTLEKTKKGRVGQNGLWKLNGSYSTMNDMWRRIKQ